MQLPPRVKDITGKRIGSLTIVKYLGLSPKGYGAEWLALCDCGRNKSALASHFKHGTPSSCGCQIPKVLSEKSFKHGFTISKELKGRGYHSWEGAKSRCFNKASKDYKNYGGRGITMCERWKDDFLNFLADMGPRPPNCSLDRIDNDGNYEPGNCRWTTRSEQQKNKRPYKARLRPAFGHNPRICISGRRLSLLSWAKLFTFGHIDVAKYARYLRSSDAYESPKKYNRQLPEEGERRFTTRRTKRWSWHSARQAEIS